MIEFLRAYKAYDPAAKSLIEIALLYPGPKAIFFHRLGHFFYQHEWHFIARFFSEMGRWLTGIEIHPGAKIGKRLVIDHGMGVVVGETAEIGDDCILFQGASLGGTRYEPIKRHPTLGHRVMVGAGAKVLGPITVGNDVRIGANAVVTKPLESGTTVVGVPAVPILRN